MAGRQTSIKEDPKHYDVIVIGAGWHGLVAAKVYLEQHPKEEMLVLEAGESCGGTWSGNRLYPGLHSNNLLGTYEYPDFPMTAAYGVKENEHIPGAVLHKYLTDFAKKFGVYSRIKFLTKVEHVSEAPLGGWFIEATGTERTQYQTKKLIIASGLTSSPNMPSYPGQESFAKPYFHSREFFTNANVLKTAQNAVIIGSGKSAYDVAYAFADAGIPTHMIVRPNGQGPAWISQPWVMGGKKRLELLLSVRWMTWFSPCIFGGVDGWGWVRRFLHGTSIGRFIVSQFWGGLEAEVVDVNGYDKHPEVGKLKPWNSAYWIGSGLSIHNYPQNFFELVKSNKIKVSIADVDHLSPSTVHLSDGQSLIADVLVAATGWKKDPTFAFQFDGVGSGPLHAKSQLIQDANDEVFARLPKLKDQPVVKKAPPTAEPFRLYRFMIPASRMTKRDLAFAGMISTVSTASCATVQATWISFFLDGKLDIEADTPDAVSKEIALHTQWMRWRHPTGYGPSLPDMAFDTLPYMDLLLKDLGLKINRKATTFKDITEPYGPPDFAGLLDEWREVHA